MRKVDVAVVGAGPAGSTAAYYLAQAGVNVVLLDQATFPRDKVYGDGVSARGLEALARLGLGGVAREVHVICALSPFITCLCPKVVLLGSSCILLLFVLLY
jgi:flavin-dependent dehydrogenase